MLKGLTSTFRENCNNIELTYNEYIVINNEQVPIRAKLSDDCYENGNFIGSFILKTIQFETSNDIDFKEKEFEYYKVVDGESIKIGTFITTEVQDNDTTELVKVVGMDYGLKTQVEYTSSLDYESGNVTLMDVWNECCTLSGLESGIDSFENDDFIVDSDQFTSTGATIRDVFIGIALSSGSFVKVMNDDKIYLVFNNITSDLIETTINTQETIENVQVIDEIKELKGNTLQNGTPTPSSPVPIECVTGNQIIAIQNSLPSGYIEVDYISTNGNQYIKLNKKLKKNQKVVTEIEFNSLGNQSLFGTYSGTYIETFGLSGSNKWECRDASAGWRSSNVVAEANTKYNIELYYGATNQYLKVNGENVISDTYTHPNNESSINTFLFARNNYGTAEAKAKIKLYSFKLYDGDTLSLDLVPCFRMNDNVVGLYDLVNNVFYENNGSGVFTYGSVIGNTYEVNLGKNLFNKDNANVVNGYFTPSSTTITADNNHRIIYIPCNSNTTYTIQKSNVGTQSRFGIGTTTSIPEAGTNVNQVARDNTATSQTITTNSTAKYLVVWCYFTGNTEITFDDLLATIQIEKGSTATSYSPYFTPIELNHIPNTDYKDRIYKDSGKWYIHKETDKYNIDTSQITIKNYYTNIEYATIPQPNNYAGKGSFDSYNVLFSDGVLDDTPATSQPWDSTYRIGKITNKANKNEWWEGFTKGTGLSNIQTALTGSYIIYPLATPTTTEITNEELINQLEAIQLLKGTNNISITSEDLTGGLKLSYWNDNFEIIEDYTQLEDKRDTHPISCLRLGLSNVEGENVDLIDSELVEEYGENWLILNDNPFAYTQEKREQLITAIFNKVKGFGYSSFVSKTSFKPYLTCGDRVKFRNKNGDLIDSILLRYTHDYTDSNVEIELSAPSETSATVNYLYPLQAIDIAKRAEIIVDKERVQIEALTDQVTTIQGGLDNTYTKEEMNQLIQTATTGITNNFINSGGNNLLRNTGLWFEDRTQIEYMYPEFSLYPSDDLFMSADPHWEYWKGNAKKVKEDKAANMSGILLQTGYLEQQQQVRNGTYTLSFKYRKLIELATVNVQINDRYIELTNTEDTEVIEVGDITANNVSVKIFSDTDNSCVIYDLMLNAGSEKAEYSQHQNETTTDTVNISKGITIQSSDTNTTFKANSDGIRVYNSRDMDTPVTDYTDTGMNTNRIKVKEEAEIIQVLWKNVGNNTWISRL